MNQNSPSKKNPLLNIGMLVFSAGTFIMAFFQRMQVLGAGIVIIGLLMFYIGYRKAKASTAPPISCNERQRRLRIVMICIAVSFLLSPIALWQQISSLPSNALWIFIVSDLVSMAGLFGFFIWQYKKAGENTGDRS